MSGSPSGSCVSVSRGGAAHGPCPLQDGNIRLYSLLGTTLKDEGKLLEAKGPVTDLAYSRDGAFLAACDAGKAVTVFSVADGYSVSGRSVPVPVPGSAGGGRRLGLLSSPTGQGHQTTRLRSSWSTRDVGPGPAARGLEGLGRVVSRRKAGPGRGGAGGEDGLVVPAGRLAPVAPGLRDPLSPLSDRLGCVFLVSLPFEV